MMKLQILFSLFIFSIPVQSNVNPIILVEEILWEEMEYGINTYRIPLLASSPINGSLLAFSEARISSSTDYTPKKIALRVSRDGGLEWTQTEFIIDASNNSNLFLGSTVVDVTTKTIFLFYTIKQNGRNQNNYIRSTDDGMTWSQPVDISDQIGSEKFSPGVGHGLQVKYNNEKRGRLLVCGYTNAANEAETVGMMCIYSDNNGITWNTGLTYWGLPYNSAMVPGDLEPGEVVLTEFEDGTIYLNVRNTQHYHCKCRIEMLSHDSGESFDQKSQKLNQYLNDSAIAAAVEYTNGTLFFANAFNVDLRVNMSLHWSFDRGLTWPGSFVIFPGRSGYVASTTLTKNQDNLYLLYEWGMQNYHQYISFIILSVDGIIAQM